MIFNFLRPALHRLTLSLAAIMMAGGVVAAEPDLAPAIKAYEAEDYSAAKEKLSAPAKNGNAQAQYYLGMMYRFGWGVDRDYTMARELFEKAAEQDHHEAQSELGKIHKDGRGVERDAKKAASWFRRAAEGNLGVAQLNLARMYRSGKGVPKDAKQAYVWFSMAIQNQYMDAMGHRNRLKAKMSDEEITEAKSLLEAQRASMKKSK